MRTQPLVETLALPAPARLLKGLPAWIFAGALALGCGPTHPPEAGEPRPKLLLLVVADTLRSDHVGAYGGEPTPNLDALAAEGQAFDNLFASFHSTTMSMGSLFTGRTASLETGRRDRALPWTGETWCGMARFRTTDGADDPPCIPRSLTTLAETLRDGGYRTLGVVSNELIFSPQGYERGFERWVEVDASKALEQEASANGRPPDRSRLAALRSGNRVNEAVAEILGEEADPPPEEPLFLYVHYMDVHDYQLSDTPYDDAVERFDEALGELLALLDSRGLRRASTVFVVGDHGEILHETFPLPALTHFGNPSFDPVLKVPLIVSPRVREQGAGVLRSEDVYSLILEEAGLELDPPDELEDGEVLISEQFWQTYRRDSWKSVWKRDTGEVMLFDLSNDPGESTDVAEGHPAIVESHRLRLDELSESLAAQPESVADVLSEEDRRRLIALGYLDD